MSSDSSITWLGREEEKKALELADKHMEEIVKTTESMKEAVHLFCNEERNVREESEKVFDNEREADRIKSETLKELSKGNFQPMNRENIIRLILSADDIADNARAAAMKLSFLDQKNVNEELKEELKKLSDFALEATRLLKKAYSAIFEDPETVHEKTAEVEKMEEKVDTFRSKKITPTMVKWADDANLAGTSYILAEVEENIEKAVDGTENCADVLRKIVIGSM